MEAILSAAAAAGATRYRFADTLGVLDPLSARAAIETVRGLTDLPIEFHGHNDLGLATANTLAAIEAGASAASVTVLGLGERAGNAPLEQIAVALEALHRNPTRVNAKSLRYLAELVAHRAGMDVGRAQPIVGSDVFTHESGIHVDGMIKSRECYEALSPDRLGRSHRFVLGKHSGLAGLRHELDYLGLELTDAEQRRLLGAVRVYAERHKSVVPPVNLVRFAAAIIDERRGQPAAKVEAGTARSCPCHGGCGQPRFADGRRSITIYRGNGLYRGERGLCRNPAAADHRETAAGGTGDRHRDCRIEQGERSEAAGGGHRHPQFPARLA
jgi:homocitrate synthase NifV